jgi:hypothetical protein
MKTLAEGFDGYGWKARRHPGEFGMEIETEVKNEKAYPSGFLVGDGADPKGVLQYSTPLLPKWRAVGDGSLRNYGIEFIFKQPYTYKESIDAIDIFGEATKKVKFIEGAPATSVHVHVNMWNETFLTLGNFCTLYTLFENLLVEYAGETRRSNLFSLPTRCSETTGWNLIKMFEEIDAGNYQAIRFTDEDVKYAALNLASLSRLGSLEIRMMRGTTDPKELKEWVGILYALLKFARIEGLTPRDIISEYRVKGVEFVEEVFGDHGEVLYEKAKNPQYLIDKNLFFAASIASSIKDWNTLGDNFAKREETLKKKPVLKKHPMIGDDFHPADFDVPEPAPGDGPLQAFINNLGNQPPAGNWAAAAQAVAAAQPQEFWQNPDEPLEEEIEF